MPTQTMKMAGVKGDGVIQEIGMVLIEGAYTVEWIRVELEYLVGESRVH